MLFEHFSLHQLADSVCFHASDFCLTYIIILLQSAQTGNKPQSVPCPNIGSGSGLLSSSSSCQAVPTSTEGSDYIDCDWSEHICPDGYPYYYNCVTCESKVCLNNI